MICAACHQDTPSRPCEECGEEPLLDGRVVLLKRITTTPNGSTWAATLDGESVCVEAVPAPTKDPQAWADREVLALKALEHSGLPRYREGLLQDGQLYRVRDYVGGRTLASLLGDRRRPTLDRIMSQLAELADVLTYLHEQQPPMMHGNLRATTVLQRDSDERLTLIGLRHIEPGRLMAPDDDLRALGRLAVQLFTRQETEALEDDQGRLSWIQHSSLPEPIERFIDELAQPDVDVPVRDARALGQRLRSLAISAKTPLEQMFRPAPVLQELDVEDLPTAIGERVELKELSAEDAPTEVVDVPDPNEADEASAQSQASGRGAALALSAPPPVARPMTSSSASASAPAEPEAPSRLPMWIGAVVILVVLLALGFFALS